MELILRRTGAAMNASIPSSPPRNQTATRWDRWMRRLHLYSGLFLAPWMVIYGLSALLLNHNAQFREWLGLEPPTWKLVRQLDWRPGMDAPHEPRELALQMLSAAGLEGAWRFIGQPRAERLQVLRLSGSGNYRLTWERRTGRIRIEHQSPSSLVRFVHFLHFRAGYGWTRPAYVAWAVAVDAVAAGILFWVLSGVYLWWRQPRVRVFGGVCFVGGLLIFGVLAWRLWL